MMATPNTMVPVDWVNVPLNYVEVENQCPIDIDYSQHDNNKNHHPAQRHYGGNSLSRTRQSHSGRKFRDSYYNEKRLNDTPSEECIDISYKVKRASLRPKINTIIYAEAKPLNESNKGFKLLKSMGWEAGDSIGRRNDIENESDGDGPKRLNLNAAGLIDIVYKSGRAGLGIES